VPTALPQWMTTAAALHNGKEGDAAATAPLNTQVVTAVVRLGCSGVVAEGTAVCMPAEDIKGVVADSLNNGARRCARGMGFISVCAHLFHPLTNPTDYITPAHTHIHTYIHTYTHTYIDCARLNLAPRDLPKHAELAADIPITTECVSMTMYLLIGMRVRG
jgi:hypothetical protein